MPDPTRRGSGLLLFGVAVAWVLACFFAVALVSAVLALIVTAADDPALAANTLLGVTVEAVVYLGLAVGVFWLARASSPPRWFWALGPAGYLVAFGLFLVVMLILGDTNAVPRGEGWSFVAADVATTTLGAWLVLRRPAIAEPGGPGGPAGPASPEVPA
jgi:hypothetical protein